MPSTWNREDVENCAKDIAKDYFKDPGKDTLHSLTLKQAQKYELNDEQVRRLGRAVNVASFEEKFASLAREEDRIVDFNKVDPEKVIDDLGKKAEASYQPKLASADYPRLRNYFEEQRKGPLEEQEKVASAPVAPAIPLHRQLRQVDLDLEELRMQKRASQFAWSDQMGRVERWMRTLGNDYDEVVKVAMQNFGESVMPEINHVRSKLNQPAIASEGIKVADWAFEVENEQAKWLKIASELRVQFHAIDTAEREAVQRRLAIIEKLRG